ncbi:MAG TPA: TauD/TfdA family dioxygenase [Trebonia sp.]
MTQLDDRQATHDYQHITVRPVGGLIGAEVSGIHAGGDITPAAFAELRAALVRHKVVFLRDQHGVTDERQLAFAERFGPATKPHPTVYGDGKAVYPVDSAQSKANSWHTDVTFVDRIPAISILRAVTLPPYGGTTVWANTAAAYASLHPALKALVGQLRAIHSNLYDYAAERPTSELDDKRQAFRDEFARLEFMTEHPVVRIHPESGEPALILGHFIRSFAGLSTRDSADLFELLQRHVTKLENTVRWTWRDGDIAIWDNRATQHYAVADYDDHSRVMHRITVSGPVPIGISGDTSTVIKGDASHYADLIAAAG